MFKKAYARLGLGAQLGAQGEETVRCKQRLRYSGMQKGYT